MGASHILGPRVRQDKLPIHKRGIGELVIFLLEDTRKNSKELFYNDQVYFCYWRCGFLRLARRSLGASLGRLLKNRGLKITIQKFDPYINVDPGR